MWHSTDATYQHVIGNLVCFVAPLEGLSKYSDSCPVHHPHSRLTGPWRDAIVGRKELLVLCPCTYHRSIPPCAIIVAETDVFTGFSALPTPSTPLTPCFPSKKLIQTRMLAHTINRQQAGKHPVLPLTIHANSIFSIFCQRSNACKVLGPSRRMQGASVRQCGGDGPVETLLSPSRWERLQPVSLTVTLVLSA